MEKIKNWFFHKLAKRRLLWGKRTDLAIFEILEGYITEVVLRGAQSRRDELAQMQHKIEETKRFIKFLQKL